MPKSKTEYWGPKLRRNVERDALTAPALEQLAWRTVVIWECETKNLVQLREIIAERIGNYGKLRNYGDRNYGDSALISA